MPMLSAIPKFGSPLCTDAYYEDVDAVINALRPYSTLRTIANNLQAQGFRTPSGLDWSRTRVACYIRNRGLETNTTTKD
jgi:hypothetical protein